MDFNKWSHKDEWRQSGKDFLIVITRHAEPKSIHDISTIYTREGPHRWAVYAYIYPKHWHADKFDGDHLWQDATSVMPLHGGASLLKYHYTKDLEVTSIQVGADYNHNNDNEFTHYATAEDAYEVFRDAERLHKFLTGE